MAENVNLLTRFLHWLTGRARTRATTEEPISPEEIQTPPKIYTDEDFPGEPTVAEVASQIDADDFRESVEEFAAQGYLPAEPQGDDGNELRLLQEQVNLLASQMPDPYAPKLLPEDPIRFAKLNANWTPGSPTVTAHPCDDDGGNEDTDTTLTLYCAWPKAGTPDFVNLSDDDVVGYVRFYDKDHSGYRGVIIGTPQVPDGTAGDILYFDGTSLQKLAKVNNTDVLTLATGLPSWVHPKVKVSANDTTPDYAENKITDYAGDADHIASDISVKNEGGDEELQVRVAKSDVAAASGVAFGIAGCVLVTGNGSTVLDSRDWRGRMVMVALRGCDADASPSTVQWGPGGIDGIYVGAWGTAYALDHVVKEINPGGGAAAIKVCGTDDGKLKLVVVNYSEDFYALYWAAATTQLTP